jgi:putative glutamine amidotransferase
MPILGICRGLQLVNVALNGSLVPDITEAGKQNHRSIAGIDHMHGVEVVSGSLLEKISATNSGIVNSAHHQCIDNVAAALQVNCIAAEGIIEGIEWKHKEKKSPLLCVQWHPERIENKNTNPLSKNILEWFLNEAANYNV